MLMNTRSHLINGVATTLLAAPEACEGGWDVCAFGARFGQRMAPWLQRVRSYETPPRLGALVRRGRNNPPE
jgi:hypothetical protein